jgi:hypothetical protein
MRGTFTKDWTDAQGALPIEQRHIVARWLEEFKGLGPAPSDWKKAFTGKLCATSARLDLIATVATGLALPS